MSTNVKRSDTQPYDYVQLWGVMYRPPGAPATGAVDVVWVAPTREIAERWIDENPGTYLVQQIKPIWEIVEEA